MAVVTLYMHVQGLMGHNVDLATEVNHQLQVEAWSLRQAVHNAVANAHELNVNDTATGHNWQQAKEMLEVVVNGFFSDLQALNQVCYCTASVVSAATSVQNLTCLPCAGVLYSSGGQEYVEALRGMALT